MTSFDDLSALRGLSTCETVAFSLAFGVSSFLVLAGFSESLAMTVFLSLEASAMVLAGLRSVFGRSFFLVLTGFSE